MKPALFLLLLCLAALAVPGQYSNSTNAIPPGGMAFFTMPRSGAINSSIGAVTSFSGFDDIFARVVPPFDLDKLPPGNAYRVEVWMDGMLRGAVEIALPPLDPLDKVIAFPLYPHGGHAHYPELIQLMDLLLDAPMHQRVAHSFRIRVSLAAQELYLGEGRFQTDANFYGSRLKSANKLTLTPLVSPQPCDAATMDFLVGRLRVEFMHLTLHKAEMLADWQPDEPGSKGYSCEVRYVVQDKAGKCYTGSSILGRRLKKTGEMGVIAGYLWPNRMVGCE